MEYEYAVEQGKPVIAFLHKNPGDIPANKFEKNPEKLEKLESFRSLTEKKMVKHWTSPAELGSVVSRSLIKLIKDNPGVGWVKADKIPDVSLTEENLQFRKQIDELKQQLENLRTTAPEGTQELAQGEDKFNIHFTVDATYSGFSDFDTKTCYAVFNVSWNLIFARIAPALIDEASESEIKKEVNNLIQESSFDLLVENNDLRGYTFSRFQISDDDFNTIKIQLFALNLIQKSKKNRSVKDKSPYWTLSPYGESVMMKLRAIKSADKGASTRKDLSDSIELIKIQTRMPA